MALLRPLESRRRLLDMSYDSDDEEDYRLAREINRHRRPDRRIELKEYIHQNSGFTGIPTHSFSVAVVLPLLLIGPPSRLFTHRLLCYIICQSRLARPSRPFLLCTAWRGPVFSTSRQGFSLYFPSVGSFG
jgi:hypothetical protein